jgi:hypothetical protein
MPDVRAKSGLSAVARIAFPRVVRLKRRCRRTMSRVATDKVRTPFRGLMESTVTPFTARRSMSTATLRL